MALLKKNPLSKYFKLHAIQWTRKRLSGRPMNWTIHSNWNPHENEEGITLRGHCPFRYTGDILVLQTTRNSRSSSPPAPPLRLIDLHVADLSIPITTSSLTAPRRTQYGTENTFICPPPLHGYLRWTRVGDELKDFVHWRCMRRLIEEIGAIKVSSLSMEERRGLPLCACYAFPMEEKQQRTKLQYPWRTTCLTKAITLS